MVTFYQAKTDTSHLIGIDIYSKLKMVDRAIPGLLIYTDGIGNLLLNGIKTSYDKLRTKECN